MNSELNYLIRLGYGLCNLLMNTLAFLLCLVAEKITSKACCYLYDSDTTIRRFCNCAFLESKTKFRFDVRLTDFLGSQT
jgi:hypothetical protein